MVRSYKRRRRVRRLSTRRRQRGAGYTFNLDCNFPGGVAEVVRTNHCDSPLEHSVTSESDTKQSGGERRGKHCAGSVRPRRRKHSAGSVRPRRRKHSAGSRRQRGGKQSVDSYNRRRRRSRSRRRRRRRRRGRQNGGNFNCPSCSMTNKTFGCRQPSWDAKCT